MTSAEAANTVDSPGFSEFSDNRSGTHFISKKRLLTWTQAESQGSATGAGWAKAASSQCLPIFTQAAWVPLRFRKFVVSKWKMAQRTTARTTERRIERGSERKERTA